jgi:hypothetical protein
LHLPWMGDAGDSANEGGDSVNWIGLVGVFLGWISLYIFGAAA